jgi:hypothetical protein
LTQRRSDGALVRLTTSLEIGESAEVADRRLIEFASKAAPRLETYIPD